MKIWYVSISEDARQTAPVFFNALQTLATSQQAIQLQLPTEDPDDLENTRPHIERADLIVAEVSSPSTGSGIELGWASAKGKPIVAFHQGAAEPTPALKLITDKIFVYVTEAHILEALDTLVK